MSDPQKSAPRAKADAAFEATQTQAREPRKVGTETSTVAGGMEDRTAQLKAQRLARDAAEEHRASEQKAQAARDKQVRNERIRKGSA